MDVLKNVKYFLAVVTKQILVITAGQQEMVGQDYARVYHCKQCRMLALPRDLNNVPDLRGKKKKNNPTTNNNQKTV